MAGQDGFGTQFKVGDGATPTEAFTTVANVTSISGPSKSRETIDVTAHDSPDQYAEFIGSVKDGGEISADLNYDPTEDTHAVLETLFESKYPTNFQIVLLPGTELEHTWSIKGIITGLEPEYPYDDKMASSVTVKVTGKPTLSATGGS